MQAQVRCKLMCKSLVMQRPIGKSPGLAVNQPCMRKFGDVGQPWGSLRWEHAACIKECGRDTLRNMQLSFLYKQRASLMGYVVSPDAKKESIEHQKLSLLADWATLEQADWQALQFCGFVNE